MITGKESWSKKALRKKYFPGTRKRCLDVQPPIRMALLFITYVLKRWIRSKGVFIGYLGMGRQSKFGKTPSLEKLHLGYARKLTTSNIGSWIKEPPYRGTCQHGKITTGLVGISETPPHDLNTEAETLTSLL